MFQFTRNHHQANYNHLTWYILVCAYIMGSHTVYSNVNIKLNCNKWSVYYNSVNVETYWCSIEKWVSTLNEL
jgi:hypothetical protein